MVSGPFRVTGFLTVTPTRESHLLGPGQQQFKQCSHECGGRPEREPQPLVISSGGDVGDAGGWKHRPQEKGRGSGEADLAAAAPGLSLSHRERRPRSRQDAAA